MIVTKRVYKAVAKIAARRVRAKFFMTPAYKTNGGREANVLRREYRMEVRRFTDAIAALAE